MSMVAKILVGCFIIGACGLILGFERPEVDCSFVTVFNACHPEVETLAKTNSLVFGTMDSSLDFVTSIHSSGTKPEVGTTIVQPVSVYMVNKQIWFFKKSEYKPVKIDMFAFCVPLSISMGEGPLVGTDEVEVLVVDDGDFSVGKDNFLHVGNDNLHDWKVE